MQKPAQHSAVELASLSRYFGSPVAISLDELVRLRELSSVLARGVKRRVKSGQSGPAATKILGRGLDFAEVRGYQPGDDVRMIDWKVTARSGSTHTKLFVEERERPFFLVIDARSTMRFATQKMFKSVLAARLAALLGWSAVAHNDCVGGLVFSDTRHYEFKPRSGRRGLMSLFRAMVKAQADVASPSHGQSLASHLLRLRLLAPTGCSICVLSDFSGFDDKSASAMGTVLQRCDVMAGMINDPLELALPQSGHYAVRDADTRLGISTHDTQAQVSYAEQQQQLIDSVSEFFSRRRAGFMNISTNDDIASLATELIRQVALST